ncbi:unnamed protein product, partial [Meganyctiphanes norvegica]
TVFATHYIVDDEAGDDDRNSGLSTLSPFKTISRCVHELMSGSPGDECQIRTGRYHEEVTINGLRGTKDKPFRIKGYGDERPVWDGTVPIQPKQWDYDAHSGICSAQIDQDIYALLLGDELMTAARWPNAKWSDKTIFNNKYWGHADKSSTHGKLIDQDLAESKINATGVMGILNIGSFVTFVREIIHHEPGSAEFIYKHDMGEIHWHSNELQYYFEAGLELLDAPEEWFYDVKTKWLFFIPPNRECPESNSTALRGRTFDYGVTVTNATGITFSNLTFLAANIHASSIDNIESHIDEITLNSIAFKFPSSSYRMLGQNDTAGVTLLDAKARGKGGHMVMGRVSVINSTFVGGENGALVTDGKHCIIQNNLFEYNEWSGQTSMLAGGGTIVSYGFEDRFYGNTVSYNGNSVGYRPMGYGATAQYNHLVGQCAGSLLSDGSAIQVQSTKQDEVQISHNWEHDSPKMGVRFDAAATTDGGRNLGYNGYIGYNVAWNVWMDQAKGDNHTLEHNLSFDSYWPGNCTLCVMYMLGTETVIENNNTIVNNNAGTLLSGGRNHGHTWPIPGATVENNYSGEDVKNHLVDPDNWDFRPIKGGALDNEGNTIGPYKATIASSVYWIPGRKLYKTSTPIPCDNANITYSRDVVMCLSGYNAERHHFYFGTDEALILSADRADRDGDVYQYSTSNGNTNMYNLPKLTQNTKYFWRVDTERNGYDYKGDIWSFYVGDLMEE